MSDVTSWCKSCHATYRGRVVICPNCKATIEADRPHLAPGDVIEGKYEVVSLLGMGGMGHVYKVRHLHLHTFRAIKMLRKDLPIDESGRSRFVREAQLATRVQHPNIALVHDFATLPDGTFYMVSEFIEGVTLRRWVQTHGQFSLQLALQIAMQILSGLEVIRRASLIHRDISPDNIMIATGADGQPLAKIIDLGIAKATSADLPMADATQTGLFVGNPRYSSPEQLGALREGDVIDARVDIYSFGLVLYEMIAGEPPFISNTPQGYAIKQLTEKPRPLRERKRELPISEALDAAILKALEKNRDHRYSSAREMAAALAPFVTGTLTQTTQTKLKALGEMAGSDHIVSAAKAAPPATLTPAPTDAEIAAERARAAERELLNQVEALAQRGDISGLSQLAGLHPADTIGNAARAALDRMAQESFAAQPIAGQTGGDDYGSATLDIPPLVATRMDDVSTVAAHLPNAPNGTALSEEEESMERHRRERAAFHDAVDALRSGDPVPAEKLLELGPPLHIRQRLKTGLDDHYSAIAWAATAKSDDPRDVRAFLEKYPNSRATSAARELLRQLEQRGEAPSLLAWNEAMKDGSEAAWLQFIERYEGSPRAREAVPMLAEARDYRRAITTGTELALRVYIATWPRGRHHAEVTAALHAVIDANRTPVPASLPTPPPSPGSPRAIPLTRFEAIPGTASEPLPVALPNKTDQLAVPHIPKSAPLLEDRWIYSIAAAVAAAILIALALWWKG